MNFDDLLLCIRRAPLAGVPKLFGRWMAEVHRLAAEQAWVEAVVDAPRDLNMPTQQRRPWNIKFWGMSWGSLGGRGSMRGMPGGRDGGEQGELSQQPEHDASAWGDGADQGLDAQWNDRTGFCFG